MPILTPTFGWLDLPGYLGWAPGDPEPMPPAASLASGMEGEPVRINGRVLSRTGAPIGKARLEFWQADANGQYHMKDYKLRGVAWTGQDGHFLVNTIMPGYAGQIRNIKYLATAYPSNRKQGLTLCAAIFFATEAELDRAVALADREYVRPGARTYREDSAFLELASLPIEGGVRAVAYDIVFDVGDVS